MSTVIDKLESAQLRKIPVFDPGDRVKVHFQVTEGTRRRTQVFEGVVIKRQGSGARETFTVRKQSFGVGVERTFPVHSPKIEKIEVASHGEVRRAKLYYLRGRVGKRARVRERAWVAPTSTAGAKAADEVVPEAIDTSGDAPTAESPAPASTDVTEIDAGAAPGDAAKTKIETDPAPDAAVDTKIETDSAPDAAVDAKAADDAGESDDATPGDSPDDAPVAESTTDESAASDGLPPASEVASAKQ